MQLTFYRLSPYVKKQQQQKRKQRFIITLHFSPQSCYYTLYPDTINDLAVENIKEWGYEDFCKAL